MRRRRQTLSTALRRQAAVAISEQVQQLPGWQQAGNLALYLAADGEADPGPVAAIARAAGKTTYLPEIQADDSLRFAPFDEDTPMRENRFGIPEPQSESRPARAMNVVLLPLVAWDYRGHRLGMGGGFYDRSLAEAPGVIKVGVAFELQRVDSLPTEAWDIDLDFVVTETTLHRCQG